MSALMIVNVPLRTHRGENNREHWATAHRRRLKEKEAIAWYLRMAMKKPPKPPLDIVLVRVRPPTGGRNLDDDNAVGAMKATRDAVAEWLGIDDGNTDAVRYEVRQEQGNDWGVRIEVHRFRC